MVLRPARQDDVPAIAAIYNREVETSTATWALEPVTLEERAAWLAAHPVDRYPVVVAEFGTAVAGWGCLSPYNPRGGWAGTVECSVYVDAALRGRGAGPALLEEICRRGARAGHAVALALVSADNASSLRMCRAAAFVESGRLRGVGRKFGLTLDCVYLQRFLRSRAGAVVRDDRGRVLWMRRRADGRQWWILPGGHVEAGEWPEETVCRELEEETGLRVRVGALGYRVARRGRLQLYYAAEVEAVVGTGRRGPEFAPAAAAARGTYDPEWLDPAEIAARPCVPAGVAEALARGDPWPERPVQFHEDPE